MNDINHLLETASECAADADRTGELNACIALEGTAVGPEADAICRDTEHRSADRARAYLALANNAAIAKAEGK